MGVRGGKNEPKKNLPDPSATARIRATRSAGVLATGLQKLNTSEAQSSIVRRRWWAVIVAATCVWCYNSLALQAFDFQ